MTVTPQTNATLEQIADELRARDNFVICGHVSPDGDCVGSQLALAHSLKRLGKNVACILVRSESIDPALEFLPGVDDFIAAENYTGPCDVFVAVDVPSRSRVEEAACTILDRAQFSITLDHHACEQRMCDMAYVDPDSASASMIVWEIAKLLNDAPDFECALCAYTGLVTDTGGFAFQNADARSHEAAAEMISAGLDPSFVTMHVFHNRSIASLKLEALIVERMEFVADGQVVMSWISSEDLIGLNAVKADVDPLIDVLRSIRGIRIACILREQDGAIRGSMRAKDDSDVSIVAREFGGGGHKAAAGFTLKCSLDEAKTMLSKRLSELAFNEV